MIRELAAAITTDLHNSIRAGARVVSWPARRLVAAINAADQKLASAIDPGWEDRP